VSLKDRRIRSDDPGMQRTDREYGEDVRTDDTGDEDDLRNEVGQTLALFGMGLAIVLIGLLVGMAL
jgi:hypothetical protein